MEHIALATAFFLIVLGCVFIQGQADDSFDANIPTRAIATILVTVVLTYTFYLRFPYWPISLLIAASTAWAFCWGPEIGWNAAVRRTQAYKGLWLTLGIMPFGLPYVALRPLAYYIGYRSFILSDVSDEVARGLSGFFLGACVFVSIIA